MRRPFYRELALAAFLVVAAGCGDDDAPTTPTQPTSPAAVTDSFTGTVRTNGAETHPFPVHDRGTVTATLKTLVPDDAVIGLSLGTWNDFASTCQITLANDKAMQGTVVSGLASSLGNLCLRVYDAAGSLTQATTYEVEIVHP
jgi:hypothetical protein